MDVTLGEEKREEEKKEQVNNLSKNALILFNDTLLPALLATTSMVEREAEDGSYPACVLGVVERARDVLRAELLPMLSGEHVVLENSRNLSILISLRSRGVECEKVLVNDLIKLDASIHAAGGEDFDLESSNLERQRRMDLLRLQTALVDGKIKPSKEMDESMEEESSKEESNKEKESTSGMIDIVTKMITTAEEYRTGRKTAMELEKMKKLKHTPFVEVENELKEEALAINMTMSSSSSSSSSSSNSNSNSNSSMPRSAKYKITQILSLSGISASEARENSNALSRAIAASLGNGLDSSDVLIITVTEEGKDTVVEEKSTADKMTISLLESKENDGLIIKYEVLIDDQEEKERLIETMKSGKSFANTLSEALSTDFDNVSVNKVEDPTSETNELIVHEERVLPPSKPTLVVNLRMPGVDARDFQMDTNIEEIDAIAGIKYEKEKKKKKKKSPTVKKVVGNNSSSTVAPALDIQPTTTTANTTTTTTTNTTTTTTNGTTITMDDDAKRILFQTPPLLIGAQWTKLRKQGRADVGLLKGAVDNVRNELKKTRRKLDSTVHDYCGALNRHVMLDLEKRFVSEQLAHGAKNITSVDPHSSLLTPNSGAVSALEQIVSDILIRSRNGSSYNNTEIGSSSIHEHQEKENKKMNAVFYMLVPKVVDDEKEPVDAKNISILTSSSNRAISGARQYVAHYYSEIRTLERRTLMLMEAKENSWETYVEEYLLQTTRRRSRNEKSRQSLLHQSNPGDSVSSAQAIAAVAMDNMASALTDKMQARLSSFGSKAQSQSQQEKLDRDYLAKKERASRSRSRVEEQKKTARSSLSENVRSDIFQCASDTRKQFTKAIHARVALAHHRAMEAARRAAAKRALVLLLRERKNMTNTRNTTTKKMMTSEQHMETERETLVRELRLATEEIMRARNISSRVKARSKADMCEIRLAEFDEIVEARGEVANATEFRVTAGSSGNQTQVEIEDRRVTKGLKRLAKALEKQRLRRHPVVAVKKNATSSMEMIFMAQCLTTSNVRNVSLANATKLVVDTPTTNSMKELVVVKNDLKTQKRVCRLKLSIKMAMEMLKKTTEEEDRTDIKQEIKLLAHQIAMLTKKNKDKEEVIL